MMTTKFAKNHEEHEEDEGSRRVLGLKFRDG
jgi:hypothetical protein